MGIPAYFSYILRSHRQVLQPSPPETVDRLYMDCNSILYDVFRACTSDSQVPYSTAIHGRASLVRHCSIPKGSNPIAPYRREWGYDETVLIQGVIAAIRGYIERIRPRHLVYIAFDGVAPMAKMNQQRQRRFKSEALRARKMLEAGGSGAPDSLPSTSMFTPGTAFMTTLARQVHRAFSSKGDVRHGSPPARQIIVSASDEPGEGEHKLVQHMRDFPDASHTVALYGLDSDLIMLAIYHCQRFRDFYIFREAPEFASVMSSGGGPEMFYMNVPDLAASIYSEVMQPSEASTDDDAASGSGMWRRVYDYVFLCFFLGNDFLPHFPALNLRTHGIQVLTETYRTVIANKSSQYLVDVTTGKIQWKHLHTLIHRLAAMEHELWLKEYAHRDKLAQRYTPPPRKEGSAGGSNAETVIEELPIRMRGKELYIAPWEVGWEARYYRSLVFVNEAAASSAAPSPSSITDLCVNYLEALEWVFTYYVCGCPDWRWQYRYMYPPLLCDLTAHVPLFDTSFLGKQRSGPSNLVAGNPKCDLGDDDAEKETEGQGPCTPLEQLMYVLPPSLHRALIPERSDSTVDDSSAFRFEWAFCTYFWESHLVHA